MGTPLPGAPHRLKATTTMSVELVPGDTVMLPAPTKRQPLDLDPDQPLDQALKQQALDPQGLAQLAQDPALGPPALPYPALLRDLPASSPSPTWTSLTSAVPPSMETPHL